MSNAALTAKYRPQTFAEVAGQETLKAILSRAALEDKVAPAYLFSGTRGVGKTTLARIFAKALNCRTAPAAEPCNQCDLCRAVTLGSAVDVVEIDGASNRGIDDVRRLKEVVGYAPMDGRYKIFIIDEAHMLSREAFNALLKTLEEPPARVTFIMATTEPHKFPATIISRCQHYVFKRLPEAGLVQHLSKVLSRENIEFDESAVRLIARRGAGSVRDSMSLLGQVLALGAGRLTEDAARNVLGLAGQEAFMRLLATFRDGDSLTLTVILREMLDQGLDMGFFLRELSSVWRNMFILRQSGKAAFPVVELPENEAAALLEASRDFSLTHIHACWQMTLEGQRRVLTSLEPALALELLLLNLAMLPQILSLETISTLGRRMPQGPGTTAPPQGPGNSSGSGLPPGASGSGNPSGSGPLGPGGNQDYSGGPGRPGGAGPSGRSFAADDTQQETASAQTAPEPAPVLPQTENEPVEAPAVFSGATMDSPSSPPAPDVFAAGPAAPDFSAAAPSAPESSTTTPATPSAPTSRSVEQAAHTGRAPTAAPAPAPQTHSTASVMPAGVEEDMPPFPPDAPDYPEEEYGRPDPDMMAAAAAFADEPPMEENPVPRAMPAPEQANALSGQAPFSASSSGPDVQPPLAATPSWEEIVNQCIRQEAPPWFKPLASRISCVWAGSRLILTPQDAFTSQRIREPLAKEILDAALHALCGTLPVLEVLTPVSDRKDREELKKEVYEHPMVREMQESFGARIVDYGQMR